MERDHHDANIIIYSNTHSIVEDEYGDKRGPNGHKLTLPRKPGTHGAALRGSKTPGKGVSMSPINLQAFCALFYCGTRKRSIDFSQKKRP